MWSDIDLYHAYRDFTTDPTSYPADEVREFIRELVSSITFVVLRTCYLRLMVSMCPIYNPLKY